MKLCQQVRPLNTTREKRGFTNAVWNVKDQNNQDFKLTVQKPIDVVHYPVEKEFLNPSDCLHNSLKFDNDFNFLCVAQWGPRKNIEGTLEYFLNEFEEDEVGLILKISIKDSSTIDFYETKKKLTNILNKYPKLINN